MNRLAFIVLAGTDTHADLARLQTALLAVKDLKDSMSSSILLFEGAGTKWLPELANPEHPLHDLFMAVKDRIAGACNHCSLTFGVREKIQASGIRLLDDHQGHPSLKALVLEGYYLVTF